MHSEGHTQNTQNILARNRFNFTFFVFSCLSVYRHLSAWYVSAIILMPLSSRIRFTIYVPPFVPFRARFSAARHALAVHASPRSPSSQHSRRSSPPFARAPLRADFFPRSTHVSSAPGRLCSVLRTPFAMSPVRVCALRTCCRPSPRFSPPAPTLQAIL